VSLGAVIVAGGQGRRFGSPLKCLPVLSRLIRALRLAGCSRVVIAGNHDGLDMSGCVRVRDAAHDCGPLGGIVAALPALAGYEAAMIVAGDMHRLRPRDIRRVMGSWRRTRLAAYASVSSNGTSHRAFPSLFGILPATTWHVAAEQLASRRLGVHRLWRRARARPVWFSAFRLADHDHPPLGIRAAPGA